MTMRVAVMVKPTMMKIEKGKVIAVNNFIHVNAMNGATIDVISDHALSLHQNHRRIRTKPVPAPHWIMNSHAPVMVSST